MRTIKSVKHEKQVQKARETMDIFAPLAGRMGMQWMRDELEDLAFKVINSEGRNAIIRRYIKLQIESGDVINKITNDIRLELRKAEIEADIFGRARKPYSIWRKVQDKEGSFFRFSDIYDFILVTATEADCYRAQGAIHQRWSAVPGGFKDYISQPKSNGYRSIHTTVSLRDGQRLKIQLRTRQMHEVAQSGVAAQWVYSDGARLDNPFAVDPATWLKTISERFENAEDHDEFLEYTRLEMYADQVFIFSPKGDVVKLPRGATPLDYAYAIHTRIGDSCVGAKVDHIRVPLWTRLKNGQMVEIITAKGQEPQARWMDIVVTTRAKAAIRKSLREDDRKRFIKLGTELARVAFEHVGKTATQKALTTAAKRMGNVTSEELLARLGSTELIARDVVETLYPKLSAGKHDEIEAEHAVLGLAPGAPLDLARCCQPLPGERMVGITYRGRGVVAHAIDCPALQEFEDSDDRWVDLHWQKGKHQRVYEVSIDISISRDAGVLGRVCGLVAEFDAEVSDIMFISRKASFSRLIIEITVRDAEQLHRVMVALEAESEVIALERHRDPSRKP